MCNGTQNVPHGPDIARGGSVPVNGTGAGVTRANRIEQVAAQRRIHKPLARQKMGDYIRIRLVRGFRSSQLDPNVIMANESENLTRQAADFGSLGRVARERGEEAL